MGGYKTEVAPGERWTALEAKYGVRVVTSDHDMLLTGIAVLRPDGERQQIAKLEKLGERVGAGEEQPMMCTFLPEAHEYVALLWDFVDGRPWAVIDRATPAKYEADGWAAVANSAEADARVGKVLAAIDNMIDRPSLFRPGVVFSDGGPLMAAAPGVPPHEAGSDSCVACLSMVQSAASVPCSGTNSAGRRCTKQAVNGNTFCTGNCDFTGGRRITRELAPIPDGPCQRCIIRPATGRDGADYPVCEECLR